MRSNDTKGHFGGVVVASVLGFVYILVLYLMWGDRPFNNENVNSFISENIIIVILAVFFTFTVLYSWYRFIANYVIKPKKSILYLKKANGKIYYFFDAKGNKYLYIDYFNDFVPNAYYEVLKTKHDIKEVIGITKNTFTLSREKINFFFNFYTPFFRSENSNILLVVYLIFIVSFIYFMKEGSSQNPFSSIITMSLSFFLIIYDMMYKLKEAPFLKKIINLKKDKHLQNIDVDAIKLRNAKIKELLLHIKTIFELLFRVLILSFFAYIFGLVSFGKEIEPARIIFLPLFFFIIILIIYQLVILFNYLNNFFFSKSETINNKNINIKKYYNLYIIFFLIFWFSFLTFWCFSVLQSGDFLALIITIPFWCAGIFLGYKKLSKK